MNIKRIYDKNPDIIVDNKVLVKGGLL